MNLLLGKPPLPLHHSTPLTTVPTRAIQQSHLASTPSEEDKPVLTWDCLDAEKLQKLVAGGIKDMSVIDTPAPVTNVYPHDVNLVSLPSSYLRLLHQVRSGSPSTSVPDDTTTQSQRSGSYTESETFSKLVPLIKSEVESKPFQTVHWIYSLDSGGQPAFQDIAPAFLRGNSVNIVTLKLTDRLTDCPRMAYAVRGKQICVPTDLRLTNLQLIEMLFRSTSSSHLFSSITSQGQSKPHCMIVGTFEDRAHECPETLAEKNRQLREALRYFEDIRIDNNQATGEIIIPVNTLIEKGREEVASSLRHRIINTPGTSQETEVPVKWLTFELDLNVVAEKKKRGVLTIDECQEAGKIIGMSVEEVIDSLMHLHEQTLLLYFREPLPKTVFVHAQPILNKVSAMISISIPDTLAAFPELALILPPNCHHRLKNHGLFSKELLACLPEGFIEDVFTADDLLKLLEHLLVIARVSEDEGKDEYFMPCVLPSKPVSEKLKPAFMKQADPLFLSWDQLPVPQGIFPALVVQLLQRKKSPTFQLFKPSHAQSSSQHQFRNAIRLTCRFSSVTGSLLLVDSIYWMEVYYSGQCSGCSAICHAVLEAIRNVVDKFHYQPKLQNPQQGFLCHICDPPSSTPHPCLVSHGVEGMSVTCSADPVFTDSITSSRQLCWFSTAVESSGM